MSKKYKRPDSINVWVDHFSEMGRHELGVIIKKYVPESEQYHAAAILLDNIENKTEVKEYKKHNELTIISKITLIVAFISAVAAGLAAYYAKTQAECAKIQAQSSTRSAEFALHQKELQQHTPELRQ